MDRNVTGKKIRLIRISKGITQEELCARLNVKGIEIGRSMLSRIENGNREISDYIVKVISEILGVSVQELFE
jgi:transcriptional regulator with XRE-family HTH domain